MSPSGLHINKPLVLIILGVAASIFIIYRYSESLGLSSGGRSKSPIVVSEVSKVDSKGKMASWHVKDFVDIPVDVSAAAKTVKVETSEVIVEHEGKNIKIFTRKARKPDSVPHMQILLLHGQAFSSKNWIDIGTLSLLAAAGYQAVAVDLPGYGKSDSEKLTSRDKFITSLVKALELKSPVIISPSMSGSFALPYIFHGEPKTVLERARAYIPVAPVGASKFADAYNQFEIPTLIVRGERDGSLGKESEANLKMLPNSEIHVIPDSGHACYLDQPETFHRLVYNFLENLRSP